MPIDSLNRVTDILIRLLQRYISQNRFSHLFTDQSQIKITGDPPDMLAEHSSDYVLGLYLYHVQEEDYYKNLPELSSCDTPVRYQELGLNLFYLLTADGGRSSGNSYVREQTLMGLAIKAFHEYPVLDAETQIISATGSYAGDTYVFPPDLHSGDDEFRLTLHPATSEEINKIWTAASVPMRLSAIYQVGVVFMEAEKPSSRPMPVLLPQVGAGTFRQLLIEGTESEYTFTIPGERSSRTLAFSPALVAAGETFWIKSNGFSRVSGRILLSSPAWTDIRNIDVTGWMAKEQKSDTRTELVLSSPVGERVIVPGLYQISLHQEDAVSNFSPLSVAPRINSQTSVPPGFDPADGHTGSSFSINGGPFSGDGILSVEVCMGTRILDQESHEFTVTGPGKIDIILPEDLKAGIYPVRITVNGVSALPISWFEVTG